MTPHTGFTFIYLIGIISLTLVLSMTACNRSTEPTSEAEAVVRMDSEGLAEYITVPLQPLEVHWVRFRSNTNPLLPGAHYRIIAVLRYDEETIAALQNEVSFLVRNNITLGTAIASEWFPIALKDDLELREGETATSYLAKPFEKAPYSQGRLYFVGDFVIVEMRTETW